MAVESDRPVDPRCLVPGGEPARVFARARHTVIPPDVFRFTVEIINRFHFARMKQRNDLARLRVNPGQVRALVQVTEVAGEGEVGRVVVSAVLSRDDVLDVESEVGASS